MCDFCVWLMHRDIRTIGRLQQRREQEGQGLRHSYDEVVYRSFVNTECNSICTKRQNIKTVVWNTTQGKLQQSYTVQSMFTVVGRGWVALRGSTERVWHVTITKGCGEINGLNMLTYQNPLMTQLPPVNVHNQSEVIMWQPWEACRVTTGWNNDKASDDDDETLQLT